MSSRSPYDSKQYRDNRPRVLARDGHVCAYCGNEATTVDHIVGLAQGGDHSMANLVAACTGCNSRKGQRDQARERAARLAARNAAGNGQAVALDVAEPNTTEQAFFRETDPPRRAQGVVSPRSGPNRPEGVVLGHDRPRLETIVPAGAPNRAEEIADWSRTHLGIELMEWQRHVLGGITALEADGRFRHRMALTSTARQQGKTTALAAVVGWFLTIEAARRGAPVTVLTTAHRLDVAVELFHRLADTLEGSFGAKLFRAYGRNEVRMADGSRWLIKAAIPSVGHGLSLDLIVVDEAFGVSADAIDHGLLPTMRARPNPLLLMWSTAGTEDSTVLLRYREQGIRAIDDGRDDSRLYFAEFSPPPHLDPMSVEAWRYANPALGTTLQLDTLEAEAASPDRAAFLRASVNLFVATDKSWLAPDLWTKLELPADVELPAGGVVAVETSLDESRFFGVRAVPLGDGRVAVTVAFTADTIEGWRQHVDRIAADARVRFAVTPTLDIHFPTAFAGRKTIVGYRELLQYTPAVRQMVVEHRVAHTGETLLAEHVQRAVAVKSQNSLALSSQRSPGPIELARCMVWAVALASRATSSGKPMIVVAGG